MSIETKQLTDDAMMAAITRVCEFEPAAAEKWRREALLIGRAVESAVHAVIAPSDAAQAPIAWVRFRSDGGFEGPIMDSDSRMCDTRRSFWTPLYAAPVAATAAEPKGFALVPLRLTRAMDEVLSDEGWQWEDLLAAAGAITEEQYNEIADEPAPVAWRHSHTHCLYETRDAVPLAGGDEWAEPLYAAPVAAQAPAQQAVPLTDDPRDAARLSFIIDKQALIVWRAGADGARRCQLYQICEYGTGFVLSGEDRWFETPRGAIDAALQSHSEGETR
ncbi:hypothetical protein [Paraburkholderia unamae]|uniref:DUF551 domain-containing protein n=1 Tax=Paraburkholderia unamae TaxID=219649 RepID=A0ABX5KUB4_9BURK|nr:hypothetical protein [Paraburkholderia unamae]PVX86430.1 hypothetical protein C7402_102266 [Paraburkholderia unamae]